MWKRVYDVLSMFKEYVLFGVLLLVSVGLLTQNDSTQIRALRSLAIGTVGFMQVKPNSRNVVPGEVRFSVDLRHISDAKLDAMEGMLRDACVRVGKESGLTFDVQRDRFGIKPLYVASGGPDAAGARQIAFASELTALQAARLLDGEPSPAGVLGFLSWGSVIPPLTWQRGVEMLAPGSWRRWRDGAFDSGVFADARDAYRSASTGARTSERDYRAAVGEAVRDSVRAHLVADVPVGVFLSGGLDSGAIVSAATSLPRLEPPP